MVMKTKFIHVLESAFDDYSGHRFVTARVLPGDISAECVNSDGLSRLSCFYYSLVYCFVMVHLFCFVFRFAVPTSV